MCKTQRPSHGNRPHISTHNSPSVLILTIIKKSCLSIFSHPRLLFISGVDPGSNKKETQRKRIPKHCLNSKTKHPNSKTKFLRTGVSFSTLRTGKSCGWSLNEWAGLRMFCVPVSGLQLNSVSRFLEPRPQCRELWQLLRYDQFLINSPYCLPTHSCFALLE